MELYHLSGIYADEIPHNRRRCHGIAQSLVPDRDGSHSGESNGPPLLTQNLQFRKPLLIKTEGKKNSQIAIENH